MGKTRVKGRTDGKRYEKTGEVIRIGTLPVRMWDKERPAGSGGYIVADGPGDCGEDFDEFLLVPLKKSNAKPLQIRCK